ncbi:MAG: ABC transporter permease [Salibacteraceae bacterium]
MTARPSSTLANQSPWRLRRKYFLRASSARWALIILAVFFFTGWLAPWLANDQPWYIQLNGEHYYPAFSTQKVYTTPEGEVLRLAETDWKRLKFESVIWAPIPYAPGKTDRWNGYLNAPYKGPFDAQYFQHPAAGKQALSWRFRHWLGTGRNGEDVLSGVIHGTRSSMGIALGAMLMATLVGLLLGSLAGFYGDNRFRWSRGILLGVALGAFGGFFLVFGRKAWHWSSAEAMENETNWGWGLLSFLLLLILGGVFGKASEKLGRWWIAPVRLPLDAFMLRLLEVFHAVPHFVLVIALAALIVTPNWWSLVLVLGITSWTNIARLVRAELFRVRELDYLEAARSLGLSNSQLLWRHALPNAISPSIVAIAFGVGSIILLESGLSFLGIGLPPDQVSWGQLIRSGQNDFSAWWLVVFPGLALLFTVLAFNWIGEAMRDAFDPRTLPGSKRVTETTEEEVIQDIQS